jgi:hypothetical protein
LPARPYQQLARRPALNLAKASPMPKSPKPTFEQELHELIARHLGKPRRLADFSSILFALDRATQDLEEEVEKQFSFSG